MSPTGKIIMKRQLIFTMFLLFTSTFSFSAEYLTFFLGGQSNMDGYGYVNALPQELNQKQDTLIFHGNGVFSNKPNGGIGIWSQLQPGHGFGFNSDGITNNYSERFGPELSFANEISKLFPNKKIAFIKYAVGGTGLHLKTGYGNWSPDFREGEGKNQYDYVLTTIKNAFSITDIDGDGEKDTLKPAGIIWMQGEADAHTSPASANAYFDNLTRLMALLRAALRDDSIPIVLGKITDSELGEEDIMPYIRTVHLAQEMFVEQDICAGYMTQTDNYSYTEKDAWHYLTKDYISMGRDFANTYHTLVKGCQ